MFYFVGAWATKKLRFEVERSNDSFEKIQWRLNAVKERKERGRGDKRGRSNFAIGENYKIQKSKQNCIARRSPIIMPAQEKEGEI